MFICEIWLFHWYFPQYCTSDMSKYGYLEVFQRVPSTSRQEEVFLCATFDTRVSLSQYCFSILKASKDFLQRTYVTIMAINGKMS